MFIFTVTMTIIIITVFAFAAVNAYAVHKANKEFHSADTPNVPDDTV